MEAVRTMKFSAEFCHLMTTPMAKLALERGEEVHDDVNGRLLTEEWFEADKRNYVRDVSLPGIAGGLLGFKKVDAKDGIGYEYEAIRVPAPRQGEISGVQAERPMLGEGQ
jgi:hypothetical protein